MKLWTIVGAVLLLAGCAAPSQQLAHDKCQGHWQVITAQVNGKTIYSAACAPSSK
jgi:uncharacterized lipoprotein YajG